jgi:hypothetical protein
LRKTVGGWVLVHTRTCDGLVVDERLLTDVEPRSVAVERMKIELVRRYLLPGGN